MKFQNEGFDHVEFVVEKIAPLVATYKRMGFEVIGERDASATRGTRTVAMAQGFVRILLTEPVSSLGESQDAVKFLRAQSEGVCVLAVDVDDAEEAFEEAVACGARVAMEPQHFETAEGTLVRAEIWTPGRVRYAFITRTGRLLDEGLVASRMESPSPMGIRSIDHLTNNVGIGEMKDWVAFYKQVFDFKVTRHFHIKTGRTGLISDVVESSCRKIKVPINEATEPESQVQEFVVRLKGPGVQHLALQTTDISHTVKSLRDQGFKFLTVPDTYYEAVPTRVPGVTENLADLQKLGVLLDGDDTGYLLQLFTEEALGPFFFEYIQRRGNQGFGEGNFKALFESIERDQIRRGVL